MISFSSQDIFLVAGASSGLGASSARLLNSLGAQVVGLGRDAQKLAAVAEGCPYPENFHAQVKDLAEDPDSLGPWLKGIRERYGKLRGLLYSAGIVQVLPVQHQKQADMERLFRTNCFAAYQLGRAFLDRRNNTGPGASLVYIASIGAWRDNIGTSAYAASKGAVLAMATGMAAEYAGQGIRVNCISPDCIMTPMTENSSEEHKAYAASFPLGPGQPEDIARTAAFLLSSASRWITGQNIVVDGGSGLR